MAARQSTRFQATDRLRIAALVPTFRERDELAHLVKAIDSAGFDRVVIADATEPGEDRAVVEALADATHAGLDVLLDVPRGRAKQQNTAAAQAAGAADVLLFVHADTQLQPDMANAVRHAVSHGAVWGRCRVRLDGPGALLRIVETLMELRSRLTGLCTGDQCIFVTRSVFDVVGGFPDQPLMEDIEISARLKRLAGRPVVLPITVSTSARRWQTDGPIRTIVLMWRLRLLYALGVDPQRLADLYSNTRR